MKLALLALWTTCCAAPAKPLPPPPLVDVPAPEKEELHECATPCGLELQGILDECVELAKAESRILAAYSRQVKTFSYTAGCYALQGWKVRRREITAEDARHCPSGWYDKQYDWCLRGFTHVKARKMEVTGGFSAGSLAHEMGHVMLGAGHCAWKQRGIKAALKLITGSEDKTKDDCD